MIVQISNCQTVVCFFIFLLYTLLFSVIETYEELEESPSDDSDEEIKEGELLPRIQRKFTRASALCSPKVEENVSLCVNWLKCN